MRSSSVVSMINLVHIFRNCNKIEFYCVLVVGAKKQKNCTFQCLSSGRIFVPISEYFKVTELYLMVIG